MISAVFLVITTSIVVYGQTNKDDFSVITIDQPTLFNEQAYREKICKSEPTCNLIKDITPKELTTLQYRNCMCDADCATYGDCCSESKYFNATQQKQNFHNFHCSYQEDVYMITTCPKNYNNITIRNKCEKSTLPLDTDNVKLIIPVTNVNTRITYGNEYCAQCHGVRNYRYWNETRVCSVKHDESIRTDDFRQNYPVANLDNDTSSLNSRTQYYRLENFTDLTENGTSLPQSDDLYAESLEATKFMKFNSTSKTFYSLYNNRNFACSVARAIPDDLNSSVRKCKKFVSECSIASNKTLTEKCRSYTSIVFDGFTSYRNKECAACNNVTQELPGCFSPPPAFGAASNLFSTSNKATSGDINPCKNPSLKDKFCS
ncbi:uncharacterized protein LOC135839978 [Planococcus citri]|uniref:uncharacterized protein LOC135839978 n=1 Tax=Planococcus citri TaxID=170843 RepID=UPI0031F94340